MTEIPQPNETAQLTKPGRHPIVTGVGIGCGIVIGLFVGVQICALIYLLSLNQP